MDAETCLWVLIAVGAGAALAAVAGAVVGRIDEDDDEVELLDPDWHDRH